MAGTPSAAYLGLGRTGESAWWRYLLGAFLVALVFIIAGVFWYLVIILISTHGKLPSFDPATGQPAGIDPMVNYVAINIPALFLWLCTYLSVRFLHRRPFLSLLTAAPSFNWRRMVVGFAAWTALAAVAGLVGCMLYPQAYKFVPPGPEFFAWLPLIFLMTPVQCAAEEFFFRGYLLQAFGKKIKNIWIAAFVNGLCFMLPHMFNPEVSYGIVPMALCYFSVGFIFALIVLRTGGLEMAIGAHIANNLFDGLILNDVKSVLTTRSIFVCIQAHPWYEALSLIVLGAVLYLIIDRYVPRTMDNPVK